MTGRIFLFFYLLTLLMLSDLDSGVLIDDFQDSDKKTLINTDIIYEEGWGAKGFLSFEKKNVFGKSGFSLKLKYDLPQKGSYSIIKFTLNRDVHTQTISYISFWLKQDKDLDLSHVFAGYYEGKYKIKQVQYFIQNKLPDSSWQKVLIPVTCLGEGYFRSAQSLVIMLKNSKKRKLKGVITIDNVVLGTSSVPITLQHYHVNKIDQKVWMRIDGLLNESAWKQAPLLILNSDLPYGTSYFSPHKSPKEERGKKYYDDYDPSTYYIKMLHDSDYFYLGIISNDKYIESDINQVFGLNADGLFSFVMSEKGVPEKLKKYRITWIVSPPRPYDLLVANTRESMDVKTRNSMPVEGVKKAVWKHKTTKAFQFNQNNQDDGGYAFELRIPLDGYRANDRLPVNINLVDHDLNPKGAYNNKRTKWRKFWWGAGSDNTAPPPQSAILSKNNFWYPQKPNHLEVIKYSDKWIIKAECSSQKKDSFIECLYFEYSTDSIHYSIIDFDYNTDDNIYQISCEKSQINIRDHFYIRAVSQNVLGNITVTSPEKIEI